MAADVIWKDSDDVVHRDSDIVWKNHIPILATIPPAMHKDLIDPYSDGAWLWLCQIIVPGYATIRIARNTEDVSYGGKDYDKFNLGIGEQIFSGDGSIPRITLQVFQDVNRVVEDIVNATEGALGATVKLIRVNEKFLDTPVIALEANYQNLAAQSDTEWVGYTKRKCYPTHSHNASH